jgi:hypothetical protein
MLDEPPRLFLLLFLGQRRRIETCLGLSAALEKLRAARNASYEASRSNPNRNEATSSQAAFGAEPGGLINITEGRLIAGVTGTVCSSGG